MMQRYPTIEALLIGSDPATVSQVTAALKDSARFQLQLSPRLNVNSLGSSKNIFDVILWDVDSPESHDLQFLGQFKKAPYARPVIVLTDNKDENFGLAAIQQGAQECLLKSQLQDGILQRTICHVIERSQIEQALRESEQKLQAVINTSPLCIKVLNAAGEVLQMNLAGLRILDAPNANAIIGQCAFDLIAPEHREQFKVFHQAVCQGQAGRLEFDIISLAGERRSLQTDSVPLLTPSGTTEHLAITQDITPRKRAESELYLYECAIKAASQGIVIADTTLPDEPVIYVNPGFEKMTGYAAADIVGKNCRILQGPDTDSATVEKLRTAVKQRSSCAVEILNYRHDGAPFWNAIAIAPLSDPSGVVRYMVSVMTDMTEWRMLESQFRQAQKLEAIGRLAGGIAHDFNNLLTIILGSCEELRTSGSLSAERMGVIGNIQQASERAAALTRQLLAFSRKQMLNPRQLNLNEVLLNILKLATRLLGEDVELRSVLSPSLWEVKIDQGQFEQVILNLAVNARDAMPRGGQLSIETTNIVWTEEDCRGSSERKPGHYVALRISDTGSGIPPAIKPRIFEPFFTTKEPGKGTGLGLSVVYGIIKQSDGYLEVESELDHGTTFQLYFPASREPTAAVLGASPPEAKTTILLVEDDEGVRTIVRHTLQKQGYQVIEASNGQAALDVATALPQRIQLLLTDLVLPVMSGRQLAKHMCERDPALKVICMTGYAEQLDDSESQLHQTYQYLYKPFSMNDLTRRVKDVLQEHY